MRTYLYPHEVQKFAIKAKAYLEQKFPQGVERSQLQSMEDNNRSSADIKQEKVFARNAMSCKIGISLPYDHLENQIINHENEAHSILWILSMTDKDFITAADIDTSIEAAKAKAEADIKRQLGQDSVHLLNPRKTQEPEINI
ncbi:MAG: hypothetical protein FWE45_01685 [Firmicutes bacterium]|nr:hypothetical protein [Bacillota bacterium]